MATPSKPRSFLAAARVANLPGVACHGITGGLLAFWLLPGEPRDVPTLEIAVIALAAVLLCVAGNLLNDWHDRAWDAKHRPERALPSGHFRPETFLALGSATLLIGVAAMFCLGMHAGGVALGIAACIAIYTRCHKRTAWSVIPLAMCRALLPLMGALAIGGVAAFSPLILALCAALFLWVCGLSLDARGESTGVTRRSLAAWLLILAAPIAAGVMTAIDGMLSWLDMLPVALWLVMVRGPYRHTAKQRVSALLAGLPLLDFMVLAPVWHARIDAPPMVLWIPIMAFALGRTLQRVAVAT